MAAGGAVGRGSLSLLPLVAALSTQGSAQVFRKGFQMRLSPPHIYLGKDRFHTLPHSPAHSPLGGKSSSTGDYSLQASLPSLDAIFTEIFQNWILYMVPSFLGRVINLFSMAQRRVLAPSMLEKEGTLLSCLPPGILGFGDESHQLLRSREHKQNPN